MALQDLGNNRRNDFAQESHIRTFNDCQTSLMVHAWLSLINIIAVVFFAMNAPFKV